MDEMMEHSGDVEDAIEYADWETEDYEITDQGNWMSSNYVSRAEYDHLYDKLKQAEKYLKALTNPASAVALSHEKEWKGETE